MTNRKYVGRYQKNEVPEPLQYQFQRTNGTPLSLTTYSSVAFWWRAPDGTETNSAAVIVDPSDGVVQAVATAPMTAAPGKYEGVFWLAPGPVPSISLVWTVVDGPGPTAPAP